MTLDYFVDETFHTPSNSGKTHFYVLALVGIERSQIKKLRRELKSIYAGTRWHSTEILARPNGRIKFLNLASRLGPFLELKIYVINPIPERDRTGELSRKYLIEHLIRAIQKADPESFVTFEQRSGGQYVSDKKTLTNLNVHGFNNWRVRSPADERLLWLPDTLATSYRRYLLNGDSGLMEGFNRIVTIEQLFPGVS
ncbi:MAG: hypothetical protein RL140_761 [Actinomycetota bacterium]|jgi:hypothetical protein